MKKPKCLTILVLATAFTACDGQSQKMGKRTFTGYASSRTAEGDASPASKQVKIRLENVAFTGEDAQKFDLLVERVNRTAEQGQSASIQSIYMREEIEYSCNDDWQRIWILKPVPRDVFMDAKNQATLEGDSAPVTYFNPPESYVFAKAVFKCPEGIVGDDLTLKAQINMQSGGQPTVELNWIAE